MSSALKTIDPGTIDIVFAGIAMEGYAEDTYLEITPRSEAFKVKVGVDGTVSRIACKDRTADCTITLMATSETNKKLSDLHKSDRNTPNGAGVGEFEVFDRGGTTVLRASKAFIVQAPDVTLGNEVTTRAWKLLLCDYAPDIGGNSDT